MLLSCSVSQSVSQSVGRSVLHCRNANTLAPMNHHHRHQLAYIILEDGYEMEALEGGGVDKVFTGD